MEKTKGITADYVILGKLICIKKKCIKTLSKLLSQLLHESSCTLIQVSLIGLFIARVVNSKRFQINVPSLIDAIYIVRQDHIHRL